jgi:hypothetical protein
MTAATFRSDITVVELIVALPQAVDRDGSLQPMFRCADTVLISGGNPHLRVSIGSDIMSLSHWDDGRVEVQIGTLVNVMEKNMGQQQEAIGLLAQALLDERQRRVETEELLREQEELTEKEHHLRVIAETRLADNGLPPPCACGCLSFDYYCRRCGERLR